MNPFEHSDERFDDDDVVDEILVSGREIVVGFAALDPDQLPTRHPWSDPR